MEAERHNNLFEFSYAAQARIRKLCLAKTAEANTASGSTAAPCVRGGFCCFECQDEVGVR